MKVHGGKWAWVFRRWLDESLSVIAPDILPNLLNIHPGGVWPNQRSQASLTSCS